MKRNKLDCNRLENRLTPSSGGMDPWLFHVEVQQATHPPSSSPFVYALAQGKVEPSDGRFVFVGATDTGGTGGVPGVARYLSSGALDPSFGDQGNAFFPTPGNTSTPPNPDQFLAFDFLSDGRILVAGLVGPVSSVDGNRDVIVVRLNTDGSLDSTFGTNGKTTFHVSTPNFRPTDVAPLADGSALVLGNGVVHVLQNGTLDPSFGSSGVSTTPDGIAYAGHVNIQPGTGRILLDVSRSFDPGQSGILALTPNGQIDSTYGINGLAITNCRTSEIFIRSDGAVTIEGPIPLDPSTFGKLFLARFTRDGQVDTNFGTNGVFQFAIPHSEGLAYPAPVYQFAITQGTAGSFLVYTHAASDFSQNYVDNVHDSVTRIQSFGAIDLSFGTQGTAPAVVTANWIAESPVTSVRTYTRDQQYSGAANGRATDFDPSTPTFSTIGDVNYFPLFNGPVRTATADVNGDGIPDLIGAAGPGGGPHVIVVDGKTGLRMAEFFAFEQTFSGGLFVAAGDVNGDGKADLVITPDQGGGPVVAVYDGAKLAAAFNNDAQIARFFGIDDPRFRGGARAAVGDVDGDQKADILVSAGYLGGPRVSLYSGAGLTAIGVPPKLVPDFFAFESSLRDGAFVSLGDLNGDGKADLIFGGGPNGGPRIRVFDGAQFLNAGSFTSLDEIPQAQKADFFASDPTSRGGVHPAIGVVNGKAALITGSGANMPAKLQFFTSTTLFGSANPVADQEISVYDGAILSGGVYVG
ncbi:MAG: FG-GAP-like repeat-containing protein [Gemmataceae bacterium]